MSRGGENNRPPACVIFADEAICLIRPMRIELNIQNNAGAKVAVIDVEGTIGASDFEDRDESAATYPKFREKLDKALAEGVAEIVVNIRSGGGIVEDAILIYEALRECGAKVTTRCYGYTASAATIIAQAASEGCREISANALYLIHQSLISTEGNANALIEAGDMLKKTDERLAEIYAWRSGREVDAIKELMQENNGNGRWLSATEAMDAGLADRVIEISPKTKTKMESKKNAGLFRTLVGALASALGVENPIDASEEVLNQELATKRGGKLVVDVADGEEVKVGDACTAYITPEGESVSPDGYHVVELDGKEVEIIVSNGRIEEIREPAEELERANARITELEGLLAEAQANAKTEEEIHALSLIARVGGVAKIEAMTSNYHPAPRKVEPKKANAAKSAEETIAEMRAQFREKMKK